MSEVPQPAEAQLSDEQLRQLQEGPGLVNHRAPMKLFDDEQSFQAESRNFHGYFLPDSTLIGQANHRCAHYQRFAIVHPQLNQQLRAMYEHGSQAVDKEEATPLLFEAYRYMAQLVDAHDHLVQNDGKINPYFLLG